VFNKLSALEHPGEAPQAPPKPKRCRKAEENKSEAEKQAEAAVAQYKIDAKQHDDALNKYAKSFGDIIKQHGHTIYVNGLL
jgi:hypothetical protein